MNFDYHLENSTASDSEQFRLLISDDIRGFTGITYTTDWTPDRFEMYHDAIAFLNSLIKSAEGLKGRMLSDIKEALDEMAQTR